MAKKMVGRMAKMAKKMCRMVARNRVVLEHRAHPLRVCVVASFKSRRSETCGDTYQGGCGKKKEINRL